MFCQKTVPKNCTIIYTYIIYTYIHKDLTCRVESKYILQCKSKQDKYTGLELMAEMDVSIPCFSSYLQHCCLNSKPSK